MEILAISSRIGSPNHPTNQKLFPKNFDTKCVSREKLPRLVLAGILAGLLASYTGTSLWGQTEFSPEHEQVRTAATDGVEFLKQNPAESTGEAILSAIATIEFTKRYEFRVPVDHPTVKHALKKTNLAMKANPPLKDDSHMYALCLAVILYCDCDSTKYQSEIKELLGSIFQRQNIDGSFGYRGQPAIGDTSQTQYAALALWVAKSRGFTVPPETARKCLDWLCKSRSREGSWFYQASNYRPFGFAPKHDHSIHCSGLSTVYLLSDYLQLVPTGKRNRTAANSLVGLELPVSVSIHVEPKSGTSDPFGPLVPFDSKTLLATGQDGNRWLANNWTVDSERWNYYYLYALERYAFFREKLEGSVSEIPDWYDQGVHHLLANQGGSGEWPGGQEQGESSRVNTSLAILFLVRASQVLVLDEGRSGQVRGNLGFEEDVPLIFGDDGTVYTRQSVRGLEDIVMLLQDTDRDNENDLGQYLTRLGPAIGDLVSRKEKSRNEHLSVLRGLLADPRPNHRRIAIRLLTAVQELENAPALIAALSDSKEDVRREAHNGLRLISRKIDTIQLSDHPTAAEYAAVKEQWTQWYQSVNPGAPMLD